MKAIQVYREVGYPYLLMPDHVPVAPDDPGGLQSFAFCYGYIRGLIQSLERATLVLDHRDYQDLISG